MNTKEKGRAKQLNLTRPNWYPRQCLHQCLFIMVTATVQESTYVQCPIVSFTVTKKYCTSKTLCPESLDHDMLTCVQIWLCDSRLCTCLPVSIGTCMASLSHQFRSNPRSWARNTPNLVGWGVSCGRAKAIWCEAALFSVFVMRMQDL